MTPQQYLAAIHLALVDSPIVADYALVRERVTSQSGYLRIRAHLANGDFLEAAELFGLTSEGIRVLEYRHQWMNGKQTILRKRWDNAPHYPGIKNAPHHIHDGSSDRVLPGQPMSIQNVLSYLAQEIAFSSQDDRV
jgi:hypothetical protein